MLATDEASGPLAARRLRRPWALAVAAVALACSTAPRTVSSPRRTFYGPPVPPAEARAARDEPPAWDDAQACVHVTARDAETDRLLPVRVVLRGVEGTPDPDVGPAFAGVGSHNIVVMASGAGVVPVAPGRYEVTVSHGPEWSIARSRVEVLPTRCGGVEARLARAVRMDDWTACDLHVHARPSYDAHISMQDRVASLVAEGIEFALPSEHNLVGDYAPGIAALPPAARSAAGGQGLVWLPAVEVTTARAGHFNIFPFNPEAGPRGGAPPPGAPPGEIFRLGRANNPDAIIQVNHPRMGHMGYFNRVGFVASRNAGTRRGYDPGYDALEVFNGFHLGHPTRVDLIFRDWLTLLAGGARYVGTASSDSHMLAYRQAGYPRTYVYAPRRAGAAPDPSALLRALRAGHAFGTSGPMLAVSIGESIPGDTVSTSEISLPVRIRVEAAAWIDVDQVEVYRNGRLERVVRLPATAGPVRYDGVVRLLAAPGYVVVAARGDGDLDAVLPRIHARPFAFTNPIWITREGETVTAAPVAPAPERPRPPHRRRAPRRGVRAPAG